MEYNIRKLTIYYHITTLQIGMIKKGAGMHLVKDENGNPIPHGAHEHCAEHGHCQEQECSSCKGEPEKESLAVLSYMLTHNEHHAQELDQMAENLEKLGMKDAAAQIKEAVSEFQKGNMRLSLAVTLVKEHIKEA